jgi:hypothetical protein
MGRTSLLMIIVFNLIFLLVGKNLGSISSQAYKNYSNYDRVAQTRFLTESAANIAVGRMSETGGTYSPTGSSAHLFEGTCSITRKDTIIQGNASAKFTIKGNYEGISGTTIVLETLPRFSRYAVFTVNDPTQIEWGANNICDGPFYTGGNVKITDNPTFFGDFTYNGVINKGTPYNPLFLAGPPKNGPKVDFNINFDNLRANADIKYTGDKYLEFKGDRVIVRNNSYNGSLISGQPANGYLITDLAPNGVLLVQGANLHIKGNLKGRLTVGSIDATVASTSSTTYTSIPANGNVYIDSSITYSTTPKSRLDPHGSSNDMLGIVADNEVIVSKYYNSNSANGLQNADVILSKNGGLMAEDPKTAFNKTGAACTPLPPHYATRYSTVAEGRKQTLIITGGLQQANRRQVGYNADGFDKYYSYDERLQSEFPPSYPSMLRMRVLSWYDKVGWDKDFWD